MKKKSLLFAAAIAAIALGIVGMSAFEAHVINVTAQIENALTVNTNAIDFGTVFPQEALDETFDVTLSQSFLDEGRVDDVNYMIRQKPKCVYTDALNEGGYLLPEISLPEGFELYGRVTEIGEAFVCEDSENYTMLPNLCPFLSKHEITTDGQGENDGPGINAFHGPIEGWNMQSTLETQVLGRLAKSEADLLDTWNIDFRVPCFAGMCAQDWADFVLANNPDAIPADYILPADLEHSLFGCDLWLEVGSISLTNGDNGNGNGDLCTYADVMLVLDRSGSIDEDNMVTLKSAANAFVTALLNGTIIGVSSFSTTATLDQTLTTDLASLQAAINGLGSAGDGWTNLEQGILVSSTELDSVRDRKSDSSYPDFMVIITDGEPNRWGVSGTTEVGAADAAIAAADAAKAAGTKIYVVGVGTTPATSDYLRDNIAYDSSYYFNASDFDALQAILNTLATCEDNSNDN